MDKNSYGNKLPTVLYRLRYLRPDSAPRRHAGFRNHHLRELRPRRPDQRYRWLRGGRHRRRGHPEDDQVLQDKQQVGVMANFYTDHPEIPAAEKKYFVRKIRARPSASRNET